LILLNKLRLLLNYIRESIILLLKTIFTNFILFLLLLGVKRQLLPGILFYEGIFILVVTSICLLAFYNKDIFRERIEIRAHINYSVIISFFLILSFHTTVITIVDRSISVFILDNIKNGQNKSQVIEKNFINVFTSKGISKRIKEQIKINNVHSINGQLVLSMKGTMYHYFFQIIQKIFNTDRSIIR